MPAVRSYGLKNPVRITAGLTTGSGEVVGQTLLVNRRLILSADGACEELALPIPISHEFDPSADIDDLYENQAELQVQLKDKAGRTIITQIPVRLIKG